MPIIEHLITNLPLVELEGDFRQMGRQFGEACRSQIQELFEIRLQSAIEHAAEKGRIFTPEQALSLVAANLPIVQNYSQEIYEECLGISEGANISLAQLFILQGLTDFRDFLTWGKVADGFGCTAFAIPKEMTASNSSILAQNWDLGTKNMPFVCMVHRRPINSPESYSLTVYGGLSMIGLNSEGIAVGTTNIKSTDSTIGVHYLHIIHNILSGKSLLEAEKKVIKAPRSGAHFYLLGDRMGKFKGIECTALNHAYILPKKNCISHCNHILHPSLVELEAEKRSASTCFRQERITSLLNDTNFSIAKVKEILADHEGEELAICRHDKKGDGISTNAAVIIEPQNGKIHACRSQPHLGNWRTFSF